MRHSDNSVMAGIMVLKYHCCVAGGIHITMTVSTVFPFLCDGGGCVHITTILVAVVNSSLMGGTIFKYLQWFLS